MSAHTPPPNLRVKAQVNAAASQLSPQTPKSPRSASPIMQAFLRTPLGQVVAAVKIGDTSAARALLLKNRELVSSRDTLRHNCTVLHWAAERASEETMQMLIDEFDAQLEAHDQDSQTPLHWAVLADKIANTEALVTKFGASVNAQDNEGWAGVHLAARRNNPVLAEILLKNGASVDLQKADGATALHVAAWTGGVDVIKVLCKYKADVNARKSEGWSPLQRASQKGHLAVAVVLLENGADVNQKKNDGVTALHIASWHGNMDIVRLLMKHGANKDAQNNNNCTPLHWAAERERLEVCKLLIEEYQADALIPDEKGRRPIDMNEGVKQLWEEQTKRNRLRVLEAEKELTLARKQIADLTVTVEQLEGSRDTIVAELEEAENQKQQLEASKNLLAAEVAVLEQSKDEQNLLIAAAEAQAAAAEMEKEALKKQYESEIDALNSEISEMLAMHQEEIERLKQQSAEQMQALNQELETLRQAQNTNISSSISKIADLQATLDDAKQQTAEPGVGLSVATTQETADSVTPTTPSSRAQKMSGSTLLMFTASAALASGGLILGKYISK